MVSQSSQKVQEWLEGVQPVGDDAVVPPMTDVAGVETSDVGRMEPSVHVEMVVVEPDEKTESEALETTETAKTADTEAETETVAKTAADVSGRAAEEGREKLESVPVTVDERTVGEEARSVSGDTETTSLAPGDSASEINSRVAAAAAAATTTDPAAPAAAPAPAPAAAAATPASRLAKLAARLPQLGAVLNSTPRLQKQSEVVSLDDSDEEAKPEQSDLDKFVQRFVRHSNAKPKKAEKKTVNIR